MKFLFFRNLKSSWQSFRWFFELREINIGTETVYKVDSKNFRGNQND
jgi:hypothetical protein